MNNISNKVEFQVRVYNTLQNLISSSDNKATIALTLQTFFISSVIGTSILTDIISQDYLLPIFSVRVNFLLIIIFFTITSIIGISLSLVVIYPRKSKEKSELTREGLTYYLHITNYKLSNHYEKKVSDLTDDKILEEYNKQNFNLAFIVRKKMLLVKITLFMILLNLVESILIIIAILVKI